MSLSSLPTETLRLIFSIFYVHCHIEQHVPAPYAFFHSTPFQQQRKQSSWYSLDCQALARFARGLIALAKALEHGCFPLLKQILCDIVDKDRLEEYGVTDAFSGMNIDFGYSCWPESKFSLEEIDRSPPRTPSSMPLPEETDSDL